ncbi:MAG: glycosyltransferase [Desulfobulbaceae bacterium]|nr:glycosyltransferase [Desulfobulbaceae bacterium]
MNSRVFLSILIPVYNWDVASLLHCLSAQCSRLTQQDQVEIIVVDDGSSRKFNNFSVAAGLTGVLYEELPENKGRAAVRNLLVQLARGTYVLFLDADMLPDRQDFVQTYLGLARSGRDVVCGGISYQQIGKTKRADSFYIYKSMRTEALPAAIRNITPWRYIFTSNIMLRRDIAASVGFDPGFIGYGFEDIEWGIRLEESFKVEHVDNTCTHTGVMSKDVVFAKMREATDNYYRLFSLYPGKTGSAGAIGLAKHLQCFPDTILLLSDRLLSTLFSFFSWNRLLFLLFQLDKAVLVARKLKEQKLRPCQDA